MIYIADYVFYTSTSAEITPIRTVDKITVGNGKTGPVTRALHKEFFDIVEGRVPDRHGWFTQVPVKQAVTV